MPDLYLSDTLRIRDKGDGDWAVDYHNGVAWTERLRWSKATGNLELCGQIVQDLDFNALFQIGNLAAPAAGEALRKDQQDADGGDVGDVADVNTTGGLLVVHRIDVAAGVAADVDVVLDHRERVIDAWAVHTGGAGEALDTLTVQNAGNAITDAMDWSGADTVLVRAGQIDDAEHEIDAGGTLRVSPADNDAGNDLGAGTVYVLCLRVA